MSDRRSHWHELLLDCSFRSFRMRPILSLSLSLSPFHARGGSLLSYLCLTNCSLTLIKHFSFSFPFFRLLSLPESWLFSSSLPLFPRGRDTSKDTRAQAFLKNCVVSWDETRPKFPAKGYRRDYVFPSKRRREPHDKAASLVKFQSFRK